VFGDIRIQSNIGQMLPHGRTRQFARAATLSRSFKVVKLLNDLAEPELDQAFTWDPRIELLPPPVARRVKICKRALVVNNKRTLCEYPFHLISYVKLFLSFCRPIIMSICRFSPDLDSMGVSRIFCSSAVNRREALAASSRSCPSW
jgi:hypothetical protein